MPQQQWDGRSIGSSVTTRRRYLYFVLDDWSRGYSIRKVNLSGYSDCDNPVLVQKKETSSSVCTGKQSILPPAFFRFQALRGLPRYIVAALDSHIIAMQPKVFVKDVMGIVFDVRTQSYMFCSWPENGHVNPIYIPVAGRLFALSAGSCEVLALPPLDDVSDDVSDQMWAWLKLPKAAPPFRLEDVTSYALHPDERTIFVSASETFIMDTVASTTDLMLFGSHTEEEIKNDCQWRVHGMWTLPFSDGGHYDPVLNAWVGLSREPGSMGHICSCAVMPTNSDDLQGKMPAVKLSEEKLFRKDDPVERHVGATLVYLGGRSYYCLVQCISIEDGSSDDFKLEKRNVPSPHLVLRCMTFSVMYGQKGELTIFNKRQVVDYSLPETVSESMMRHPVAFWM